MAPAKRPAPSIGAIGDPDAPMALIKADDWNQVYIIARGHQLTHMINGQIMMVLIDDHPASFRPRARSDCREMYGLGRVSFRDIWLKQHEP